MKIEQPLYFYQASYDSRSKNLVLVDADKPVFTAGPLDNDGVLKLLGDVLGTKLLTTAAPPDSGWEFQIEGSWQLWQRETGSILSILVAEDGADGPFRAHAYNDAQGTQLFVDVQTADAAQGDVSLALCVMSNSDGMPSVVIHDADGTWVTTAQLLPSGKVDLLPGNYAEAGPSPDQLLDALAQLLDSIDTEQLAMLKIISEALARAPAAALAPVLAMGMRKS